MQEARLPRTAMPEASPAQGGKEFDFGDTRSRRGKIWGVGAVAVSLFVLAYPHLGGEPIDRAGNNKYITSSDTSKKRFSGIILPGVNVRTSPELLDDDNAKNNCSRVAEKTDIVGTPVIIDYEDAANGPWVGFQSEYMPEDVQDGCRNDADGIVWISSNYLLSGTNPTDGQVKQQN